MLKEVKNVIDLIGASVLTVNDLKRTLPSDSVFMENFKSLEISSLLNQPMSIEEEEF